MAESLNADPMRAFVAKANEGPVVMLNLLELKPDGGLALYRQYMAAVAPLLEGIGGKARYLGRCAELLLGAADNDWDLVLMVEYPNRGALLEMLSSPEYREIQHLREEAVTRSVLLATEPLS